MLLIHSPVGILVTTTVGLDARTTDVVVQALTRLMEGRTVIMTAHHTALTSGASCSPTPSQPAGVAR